MRKIILGLMLGIIAVASFVSFIAVASVNPGYVQGTTVTTTIVSTQTQSVAGSIVTQVNPTLQYTTTTTIVVSGSTTTETISVLVNCPTTTTLVDGNVATC